MLPARTVYAQGVRAIPRAASREKGVPRDGTLSTKSPELSEQGPPLLFCKIMSDDDGRRSAVQGLQPDVCGPRSAV